ncbi:MAG TPA: endonuclease domain-containing protein [Burkholderiales bacterium]|nr:endonuclease domain-containing protein [Burkholderiales bacterium]
MLTVAAEMRYSGVAHPPFIDHRRRLKRSARMLRRDLTPAERKLWFEFLRALPIRFKRQKPLGEYIADFYCAREMLVIEVDGDSHFTTAGERCDAHRTAELETKGVRVLRFTNLEVMQHFEAVCYRIRDALKL